MSAAGARDAPQVVAEVEEDRRHRAELNHGREGGAGVGPAEERGDDAQVRGARDRQELGEPLHDALDDGMEIPHGPEGGEGYKGWSGAPLTGRPASTLRGRGR